MKYLKSSEGPPPKGRIRFTGHRSPIAVTTDREVALEADLALACTANNPCLVCGHYRPERDGLQKCELNEWVCSWEWRGEQK